MAADPSRHFKECPCRKERAAPSPAIERLIVAVRAYVELDDGGATRRPIEEALEALDREERGRS
jgi:hypothetical protein